MVRATHDESEHGVTRAQVAAANRVKEALAALVKDAKAQRIYQGADNTDAQTARSRFRHAFLAGIREALLEMPTLRLEVSPEAIYLGEHPVMESTERRGDLVEVLFSEGLRGVAIESSATDDELLTMAGLLLSPWQNHAADQPGLADAIWQADFAHLYFEVVDALSDRENEEVGESPIVRELVGLVTELNARADAEDQGETARLRQDELAVLLRLRDHVSFAEGEQTEAERVRLESTLSPALIEEVTACRADTDMARADVAGLLTACLEAVDDEARARVIGEGLYSYVINAVLAEGGAAALVQRTAELLDPDLTPHLAHRDVVRAAAGVLAQEPTRSRIARLFAGRDPKETLGMAFTLFLLLPGEPEAIELAPALPSWAVAVLADTVLLRSAPEPRVAIDVPKRLLARPQLGAVLLGLAMAARQKDPRLIEPVIVHARHESDDVREGVLLALREHQTPRTRECVRAALADAAEKVRLEALRYSVAYRDLEVVRVIEDRLTSSSLSGASEVEVRALCIALARISGANAQKALVEFAEGTRPATNAALPRMALHGLKALNSESARAALNRLAHTIPALADEVQKLSGGARR